MPTENGISKYLQQLEWKWNQTDAQISKHERKFANFSKTRKWTRESTGAKFVQKLLIGVGVGELWPKIRQSLYETMFTLDLKTN